MYMGVVFFNCYTLSLIRSKVLLSKLSFVGETSYGLLLSRGVIMIFAM
jgi:hypothetical protein